MCSIVILSRPGHAWPLIAASNRDEMAGRPCAPPGRHWPDRAEVVAGLDRLAGGSWLGLNDHGVMTAILNRVDSLGPRADKRSRGELVLEALDHADAGAAVAALRELEPSAYRSFNMVVADNRDAFWLRGLGLAQGWIEAWPLEPGFSMITAHDRNDRQTSRRIDAFLPRFAAAAAPRPEAGLDGWREWIALLAERTVAPGGTLYDAMNIVGTGGFGTVSSSLIALPAPGAGTKPVWLFAAGRPDEAPYEAVPLAPTGAR
jgi:hypothetical protein